MHTGGSSGHRFAQYGQHGHKYSYKGHGGEKGAENKARKQELAMLYHGYNGHDDALSRAFHSKHHGIDEVGSNVKRSHARVERTHVRGERSHVRGAETRDTDDKSGRRGKGAREVVQDFERGSKSHHHSNRSSNAVGYDEGPYGSARAHSSARTHAAGGKELSVLSNATSNATSNAPSNVSSKVEQFTINCSHCDEAMDKESIGACGGCKKAFYCNETCQKNHWTTHKKTCCKA